MTNVSSSIHSKNGRRHFGILTLGIFSLYGISLFTPVLWNEEYPCSIDPKACALDQLGDIRPVYALISFIFFSLSNYFESIFIYKFFGFLGFIVLNLSIFYYLSLHTKQRNSRSLLLSVLFCSALPGMSTMAFSPNISVYSWSSFLSIVALMNAYYRRKRLTIVVPLLISLLAYPPSTFFAFTMIFVLFFIQSTFRFREFSSLFFLYLRYTVLCVGLAFFIGNIVMSIFEVERKSRVSLVSISDLGEKTLFVLSRFIPTSFAGFYIGSPSAAQAVLISLPILSLIIMSFYVKLEGNNTKSLLLGLAFFVTFMSTLTPFLLSQGNEIDFRIVRNSSWLTWFILFHFIFSLMEQKSTFVTNKLLHLLKLTSYTLLALVLILMSNYRFQVYFNLPYKEKTNFILGQLQDCAINGSNLQRVSVILPEKPLPRYENLGIFSLVSDLSQPWVPIPNVELIKQDLIKNMSFSSSGDVVFCTIDFRLFAPKPFALAKLRDSTTNWTSKE